MKAKEVCLRVLAGARGGGFGKKTRGPFRGAGARGIVATWVEQKVRQSANQEIHRPGVFPQTCKLDPNKTVPQIPYTPYTLGRPYL